MPLPAGLSVPTVTRHVVYPYAGSDADGFTRGRYATVAPQVVYLHGFASSPASSKAVFLKRRLAAQGVRFHCPNLNQPDFSTLTASRMIEQTTALITSLPAGPVVLFGSSLGAFVALQAAEQEAAETTQPIAGLVLLAPALDFGRRPVGDLGDAGMARWRETGWWELTHYASGKPARVHYELFCDARRYDAFAARRPIPTLVLQGRRDDVVDPDMVARYAAPRPHATLVLLDDDHQLGASLERVWSESARFLGLPRVAGRAERLRASDARSHAPPTRSR